MKTYDSFKPSGVPWLGMVPAQWDVLRLKEVAAVIPSNIDKLTVKGQQAVRLCNYVDVYKNHKITAEIEFMTATAANDQIQRLSLSCGDVVLTKDSETPWDIAVSAYVSEDIPDLVCGYHLAKLRPDPARIRGDFLHWALCSFPINVHFALAASGITRYGLSTANVADGNVPVPSLEEQVRIADYLDSETARIDALISEKELLIETLHEFGRSTFASTLLEAAADGTEPNPRIEWLPAIPANWSCCKVKHLIESFDQGISPQCEPRPPEGDEWGVLKVGCVNSGRFDPMESKTLPPEIQPIEEITLQDGDVMISRANTRSLVGRCAAADKAYPRLMLSDKLYRLRIDRQRCEPAFLVDIIALPAVRQRIEERATGASASMLNIDRRTILELDIVLPPLDLQRSIVRQTHNERHGVFELIDYVTREIALLHELRSTTISDAVLGRIKVC